MHRDYPALSFLHTGDFASVDVLLSVLLVTALEKIVLSHHFTGDKNKHTQEGREGETCTFLVFECVNVLARLGQRWLSALQIFHTSWLACATPFRCCKAVWFGEKHSTEGRGIWAGRGYRPLTFVEMKLCKHTETVCTPSASPCGEQSALCLLVAQLDTAVEPSCSSSPRTGQISCVQQCLQQLLLLLLLNLFVPAASLVRWEKLLCSDDHPSLPAGFIFWHLDGK